MFLFSEIRFEGRLVTVNESNFPFAHYEEGLKSKMMGALFIKILHEAPFLSNEPRRLPQIWFLQRLGRCHAI